MDFKNNINQIISDSKILKHDHVIVYNFQDKFIIKRWKNTYFDINNVLAEQKFLEFAISKWVKINKLLDVFELNNEIFVIYEFQRQTAEDYDYIKVWKNLRFFHEISSLEKFNFTEMKLPDLEDFTGLQKVVWQELFEKWINKARLWLDNYSAAIMWKNFDTIIHYDIIPNNIIRPDFLVDTEHLQYWFVWHDIGSIFRLGYRNHQYDIVSQISKWYGINFDIEIYEPFLNFKDITNMLWLYQNNNGIKERVEELKFRILNIDNYDYKWKVF